MSVPTADEVRALCERLRTCGAWFHSNGMALSAEDMLRAATYIQSLHTALAEAPRDAERYRMLRKQANYVGSSDWDFGFITSRTAKSADEAIDEAIAKERGDQP